jgi:hypothetical protein
MFKFKLVQIISRKHLDLNFNDVEKFLEDSWEEVSKSDKEFLEYLDVYCSFDLRKKSLFIIKKNECSNESCPPQNLKEIIDRMREKEEATKIRIKKAQETRAKNKLEKAKKILLKNGLPVD